MSIIDEFMERYMREYDYYKENARICAEKCELALERNGIRAIVTHRAKRPDRLRLKLEKRIIEKKYKSVKDIYNDIVDFAGIRIALYFPSDRDEVDKLIEEDFLINEIKKFPLEQVKNNPDKRFSGYWATHYRCTLRKDKLPEKDLRYANCMVEIQVASVLMHAWSEVEHDLVYKPLSGDLSEDEYELLDQLNGLVMSGEISLERLQKAVKARVSEVDKQFNNQYEFSAYIYDAIKRNNENLIDKESIVVGRTDILFRFLQLSNLDRPGQINEFLMYIDSDTEKRTISQQVVDKILVANSDLFDKYNQAKNEIGQRNPYADSQELEIKPTEESITFFITTWVAFESIVRKICKKKAYEHNEDKPFWCCLEELGYFSKSELNELKSMRRIRNRIVHQYESTQNIELISTANRVVDMIKKLRSLVEDDLKDIIDNELKYIGL